MRGTEQSKMTTKLSYCFYVFSDRDIHTQQHIASSNKHFHIIEPTTTTTNRLTKFINLLKYICIFDLSANRAREKKTRH